MVEHFLFLIFVKPKHPSVLRISKSTLSMAKRPEHSDSFPVQIPVCVCHAAFSAVVCVSYVTARLLESPCSHRWTRRSHAVRTAVCQERKRTR